MAKFCILGGGFGMYGYLPAVLFLDGSSVFTLSRYRPMLQSRPELAPLLDRVTFLDSADGCVMAADVLIVARRPVDQHEFVSHYLLEPHSGHRGPLKLILEKPPSRDACSARRLLEALRRKDISVRIAYTFPHCPWAHELAKQLCDARDGPLEIDLAWSFLAHHYRHGLTTWKRLRSQGGGALGFYGIQFLGLLASLGRWDVDAAAIRRSGALDEDEAFAATFRCGRMTARIECDSRAQESARFLVRLRSAGNTLFQFESDDPFSSDPAITLEAQTQDRRVTGLVSLMRSRGEDDAGYRDSYLRSLDLWETCERMSASGAASYASVRSSRSA